MNSVIQGFGSTSLILEGVDGSSAVSPAFLQLPIFATPIDPPNSTTLAAARPIGVNSLVVAQGTGSYFKNKPFPIRITAIRKVDSARMHFFISGISGDTLAVVLTDGYPDIALNPGDTIAVFVSAETISDIHSWIYQANTSINYLSEEGVAGPQGPIGLTGATGNVGPQGPIGLTGQNGTSAIGSPVPNAVAKEILFVDQNGNLAQSGNLTFDNTNLVVSSTANISANSAYGYNYLNLQAEGTNTGLVLLAGANGAPAGNSYVFQLNTSSNNTGSSLLIAGNSTTNKHVIAVDNSTADYNLAFRCATNEHWTTAYDAYTINWYGTTHVFTTDVGGKSVMKLQAGPNSTVDIEIFTDSNGNVLSAVGPDGSLRTANTNGPPNDNPAIGTMRFDGVNDKLWVYCSSGWKSTTLS